MPSNNTRTINHGISNIDKIIHYYGISNNKNNSADGVILPYVNPAGNQYSISLYVTKTTIQLSSNESWGENYPNSYVTILYTKTS